MHEDETGALEIWHVGPGARMRGGIATTIGVLVAAQSARRPGRIHRLATCDGGGAPRKALTFLRALARLAWLLLRRRDRILLHVHTSHGNSLRRKRAVLRLARLVGAPAVLQVHSGRLAREPSSGLVAAAAGSRALLGLVADLAGVASAAGVPFVELANPVPIPTRPPRRDPATTPRIVFLSGTDLRAKGAFDLVDALARLPTGREARCTIASPDDDTPLRDHARRRGVAGRIDWAGWVDGARKREVLGAADLFVLPSYVEGLPVAMLEAMALGVPVVATPVGAIPRLVHDGEEGRLVPPGDVAALAGAIDALLADPVLRHACGAAARRAVEEHCDPGRIADRLDAVYREAVA